MAFCPSLRYGVKGSQHPHGGGGPPPLPDENNVEGFEWLTGKVLERVLAANLLYKNTSDFCVDLDSSNHIFAVENPTGSWMWEMPCFSRLVDLGFFVDCESCAFGGARRKRTSFLVNDKRFKALAKMCPGESDEHQHEPWGLDENNEFNTAKEVEYPIGMCQAYAQVLTAIANEKGISLAASPMNHSIRPYSQVRGRKLPPIIPEYCKVVSILLNSPPTLSNKRTLSHRLGDIPMGQLLRTEAKQGGKSLYVFGIYRSCQSFANIACSLYHPFDFLHTLPDFLVECICMNLTLGPIEVCKRRLAQVTCKWRSLAEKLETQEQKDRSCMPASVRSILCNKRLNLLQCMADDIGWPDKSLFDELRSGFKLVRLAADSGVFKRAVKAPQFTEEELAKRSKFIRPFILGKMNSRSTSENNEELLELTAAEAGEKNWLQGPMSTDCVHKRFGDSWVPVRRFAVQQKAKIRPIDDFSENHVNEAWGCCEAITLHAKEYVVWTVAAFVKHCVFERTVHLRLRDGRELRGPVHDGWAKDDSAVL